MSRIDQAKMIMRAKKIQKELQKQIITVEQGEGAVKVEITGELEDIGQLERWVEDAVKEAIQSSQRLAAEKMQPMMGALGDLGF
jgi:DNA-binding protein YbaB